MKIITKVLTLVAAVVVMVAIFTACSSSEDSIAEQPTLPVGENTYTMTIQACMGDNEALTRALSIGRNDENTKNVLNATWANGDKVKVYTRTVVPRESSTGNEGEGNSQGEGNTRVLYDNVGTLAPTNISNNGTTATLTGTLTGNFAVGDELYLFFPKFQSKYENQVGTLEKIATDYDYCVGQLKVTSVSDGKITGGALPDGDGDVVFEAMQAIVKFTLLDKATSQPIEAKSLTIGSNLNDISTIIEYLDLETPYGTKVVTVEPSPSPTSEIYAALIGVSGSNVVLTAKVGDDTYVYSKSNVTFARGKYYEITVKMNKVNIVDLSEISSNYEAKNNDMLTGTLADNHKISIADGATVWFDEVKIIGENSSSYNWAGINCNGDATLIFNGDNTVTGFHYSYPGIYVPAGKTLTIRCYGSLSVSANNEDNIGGSAGIGSGYEGSCGNIHIDGGIITAIGGNQAAAIGSGSGSKTYSNGDPKYSSCGDITISGGSVIMAGFENPRKEAAGIGTGLYGRCGDITISSGSLVMAYGGEDAAGIGGGQYGKYGNITITGDATAVLATRGIYAQAPIGMGSTDEGSGSVTIDGTTFSGGLVNGIQYTPPSETSNGHFNWFVTDEGKTWEIYNKDSNGLTD